MAKNKNTNEPEVSQGKIKGSSSDKKRLITGTDKNRNKDSSDHRGYEDFLLQEYSYYAESFWKSEETGEQKLTLLITLISAVLAGLIILLSTPFDNPSSIINTSNLVLLANFMLSVLLLFGLLTLLRVIKRNSVSDEYKKALDNIRDVFTQELYPRELEQYKTYQYQHRLRPRKILTGGLVDTVIVLNSLIVAVLFSVTTSVYTSLLYISAGLAGFLFAFSWQSFYTIHRYKLSFIQLKFPEESPGKLAKQNGKITFEQKFLLNISLGLLLLLGLQLWASFKPDEGQLLVLIVTLGLVAVSSFILLVRQYNTFRRSYI